MPPDAAPRTDNVLVDRAGRPYRLIALLGEGGFGAVYLAETESSGGLPRRVALKLLHEDLDPANQAAERMRDEAAMLARLEHPAILTAHDLVEFDGQLGLVTEYVEGQDLSGCVDDEADPLPLPAVLDAVGQVAAALDTAWSRLRIVHRDIKPGNIRIGRHGNVKVLDFGIARSREVRRSARTQGQMVIGTVRYLAPERYWPEREPDPASDVFALGCVLFEAATGTPLLPSRDLVEAANLAMNRELYETWLNERFEPSVDPDGPGTVFVPRLPTPVVTLLRKMLAFEPSDRFTAAQVCDQCEKLRGAVPGAGLQAWSRTRKWPEPEPVPLDAPIPRPAASGEPRSTLAEDPTVPARPVKLAPERPRPPRPPSLAPEPEPRRVRWRFVVFWSFFGAAIVGLFALAGMTLVGGVVAAWWFDAEHALESPLGR